MPVLWPTRPEVTVRDLQEQESESKPEDISDWIQLSRDLRRDGVFASPQSVRITHVWRDDVGFGNGTLRAVIAAVLRSRGRAIAWLLFFTLVLTAWWVMFAMATGSGLAPFAMAVRGDMGMDMAAESMPTRTFGVLFVMWAIMMLAMMGPTFVPTLSSYDALIRAGHASRNGWAGLTVGFFLAWFAFAGLISAVQAALQTRHVLDMMGMATASWLQGSLLVAVGAYQFTRTKDICQGVCLSPTVYFLTRWRPGFRGGVRLGAGLGGFCVACCWGFMVLGFVGGTMNLIWMGLATVVMILEKLPEIAAFVTKPIGVVLALTGVLLLIGVV